MIQFPKDFEQLLLSYIKSTYLPAKKKISGREASFNEKDLFFFSKGAGRLSELFTEGRASLLPNYLSDQVLRSGYLLYFLPVNFLKVVRILEQLSHGDLFSGTIRILDLGCGPGTASLGMMSFFSALLETKVLKHVNLDIQLMDHNYHVLKDAKQLHDAYRNILHKKNKAFESRVSTRAVDLRHPQVGRVLGSFRYHYIIVSNFLNELPERHQQAQFASTLLTHHLDPKRGKLIVIEPALRKTSRDLQFVRDDVVLRNQTGHVLAPCLHQNKCPLNVVNQRDWCHFYLNWECPPFITKLDKILKNKKEWLKMAYMVLAPVSARLSETKQNHWRMISNLMKSKGKKELILCGPGGRYHVWRQDKEASAVNRSFDLLWRGDLVDLDVKSRGFAVNGQFRLEQRTPINRIEV